jgi:hypothetical protein
MPRASAKTPKLDRNARYRAWTSFANDTHWQGLVVTKGTRLRGDHPWVKAFPQFFALDSTDPDTDAELEMETRRLTPEEENRRNA